LLVDSFAPAEPAEVVEVVGTWPLSGIRPPGFCGPGEPTPVFFGVIVVAVPFCCASAAGTGRNRAADINARTRLPVGIS